MIRFLFLLLFCTSVFGQCNGYDTLRANRIAAYAAVAQSGGTWIVGDSHAERLSSAYAQGSQTNAGHPVYFAGIAGATWPKLRDCIPWSAIGAKSPSKIIIMAGVNDATTGSCCDANGNVTSAYVAAIFQTILAAQAITPNVVIATDPPPESAAGIDAYRVHQSARMVYYAATLAWSIFGYSDNAGTPFTFIDLYGLMGAGGSPASSAYSGGRYAAAGSTMDNVHFPQEGSALLFGHF